MSKNSLVLLAVLLSGCKGFSWPWEKTAPDVPQHGSDDDDGAGSTDGDTGDTEEPVATRIVVDQTALMLTEKGDQDTLVATVVDQFDNPMPDIEVSWTSMDESEVTVSSSGEVTAVDALGSAQLFASAEGLSSNPVLVLITDPVDEAILVPESDIRSLELPEDTTEWGPGTTYLATVTNVSASPGDILMGTGGLPLGGRVVSVDGDELVMEVVPLDNLFDAIEIEETISLETVAPEFNEEVDALFDVSEDADGNFVLEPKTGSSTSRVSGSFERLFDCTDSGVSAPMITLANPSLKVGRKLDLIIDADGLNLHTFVVVGNIEVDAKVTPQLAAAFEGTAVCDATLMSFAIPVGPIGAVFGPNVDVGAGISLTGKASITDLGYEAELSGTGHAELGWMPDDAGNTRMVSELTTDLRAKAAVDLPDVELREAQVDLDLRVYSFAKLALAPQIPGVPAALRRHIKLDVFRGEFGLVGSSSISMPHAQALDPLLASRGEVAVYTSLGTKDTAFDSFGSLLGINLLSVNLEDREIIYRTPTGSLEMDDNSIEEGQPVLLTVKLDRENLNGISGYQVEDIVIYELDEDAAPAWEALTELARLTPESDGQFEFEYEWVPTAITTSGPPVLVTFVNSNDLLAPVEVEIAKDSRVRPSLCSPEFEPTVMLTTSMGGASMQTMSVDSGSINNDGHIAFVGESDLGEDRIWVIRTWGGADTIAYVGREYTGGALINNNDPAQMVVGEYLPETDIDGDGELEFEERWSARIWSTTDVGLLLGSSEEDEDGPEFEAVDDVHVALNDTGMAVIRATLEGAETFMLWDGSSFVPMGFYGEHPRMSNSGLVVYMDGSTVTLADGPVLGSSSGSANIAADADLVSWGDGSEVYLWQRGTSWSMSSLLGSEDQIGSMVSGNNVGVGFESATCGGLATSAFVATTTTGETALFALQVTGLDSGTPGVSNLRELVRVGDEVDGRTITGLSTFDPVSDDGRYIAARATFSDGSVGFIRFSASF